MTIPIWMIVILIVLLMVLEVDHFVTVRRLNRQLKRNKNRHANGNNDSIRLKTDLLELERINNELENN